MNYSRITPIRFLPSFHFSYSTKILPKRPPIVTIMGHVDHGKTTILDYLRKSRVAAGEAGGITQHIGAFQVAIKSTNSTSTSPLITFIDTPGHAAFSAIRQRGAQITDLIVLVVAVEDGIMLQTEEVIKLAKASNIPFIVAINKWDKIIGVGGQAAPAVKKIKDNLLRLGVELEEYGGSVQCIPISAMTGFNMESLQESILAEAELMDLHSDPDGPFRATVIEAKNVLGLGGCVTAIVREGTLRPGMFCAAENAYCRVRALSDPSGRQLNAVGPSQPCEVIGWKNSILPQIGSTFTQFKSESECKEFIADIEREKELDAMVRAQVDAREREILDQQIIRLRKERARDLSLKPIHIHSYDQLIQHQQKSTASKQLSLLLHADVIGSIEAIEKALLDLPRDKVSIKIIGSQLGPPSESSLNLLQSCVDPQSSLFLAFNVAVPKSFEKNLQDHRIRFISHNIIYHLLDEVRSAMADLLPPLETSTTIGTARILQIFKVGKDVVAGCTVEDGLITKQIPPSSSSSSSNSNSNSNSTSSERRGIIKFCLERKGKSIWSGTLRTLKHLKKDIQQAPKGMECGLILDGVPHEILLPGDLIKCVKVTYCPVVI